MPSSACNWRIDASATMAESMRFFMVNRILLIEAASYFKKLKGWECANMHNMAINLILKNRGNFGKSDVYFDAFGGVLLCRCGCAH